MEDTLEMQIRQRAYELWDAAGRPEGRAMDFWLEAERDLVPVSQAGEEDPFEALDHEPAPPTGPAPK